MQDSEVLSHINIHLAWYNKNFFGMQFILMQHTLCCLEIYYVTSSVMPFHLFLSLLHHIVQYSSAEITLRLFVEAESSRVRTDRNSATVQGICVCTVLHVPAVI